jgi:hypothetical protein
MDDKSHSLPDIQRLKQCVKVTPVFYETIRASAIARQLVRVSHSDQIGSDTPAERFQVRYDIAPEERRCGIAVQKYDRVALAYFHVRHLTV